ncbi:MAG TPA: hypothetical protein DHW82_01480 [Spirochaetia bacterium]|nr:MAG: hypothetical protein A2Y41_12945 [Spirochaetes bacterium GWB1_36_13]HCL55668.1 hypothetical protein [Spirochaetia bacterium]
MNYCKLKNLFLAFLTALFISSVAFSAENDQENVKKEKDEFFWVNLNMGFGGKITSSFFSEDTQDLDEDPLLIAMGLTTSFQKNFHLFSFRFLYLPRFEMFSNTNEKTYDIGVLYGISYPGSFIMVSLSGGVSVVSGILHEKAIRTEDWTTYYQDKQYTVIGFPIEAQLYLRFPYFGIGLSYFANLNAKNSYHGILVGFQFGDLW